MSDESTSYDPFDEFYKALEKRDVNYITEPDGTDDWETDGGLQEEQGAITMFQSMEVQVSEEKQCKKCGYLDCPQHGEMGPIRSMSSHELPQFCYGCGEPFDMTSAGWEINLCHTCVNDPEL